MRIACLWLLAAGVVLRIAALAWHDLPRGDVVLDTGVVASLSSGAGFASGFERGTLLVRGDGPLPPGDRADQHAPLWPLLAVPCAWLAGSPFGGLQLASLLFGLLLLTQVWRLTDRLTEDVVGAPDGLPVLAAALVALSFLALDYSVNGSLYAAQACGVLLLVEALASPRPRPVASGVVLGLLLLLNHQCLVLLPLPLVVAVLGTARGGRARAAWTALGTVGVALALQVPWWWRNAIVFGDALHSVNGLYLLHRFGLEPRLAIEEGRPVARWLGALPPSALFDALRSQLLPNLLFLFVAGLLVLPALLGPLVVSAAADARRAVAAADRRRLAAWGAALLLTAVAVAWPATKLRYLVVLLPLGAALGVSALARPPSRSQRGGALALVAVWIALLLATLDDVTGGAPDARPARWVTLLVAGAVALLGPLLWRHRRGAAGTRRLPVGVSGLPLVIVVLAAALWPPPHTAYHSMVWLPDFFGQDAEVREAARAAGLGAARAAVLADMGLADEGLTDAGRGEQGRADAGGSRPTVIGPVALLAWRDLRLITLPLGAGTPAGAAALGALLDAPPGGGRVDHVITFEGDGWLGGAPDATGAAPGTPWLGGRLVVESGPGQGGVVLSRVVR